MPPYIPSWVARRFRRRRSSRLLSLGSGRAAPSAASRSGKPSSAGRFADCQLRTEFAQLVSFPAALPPPSLAPELRASVFLRVLGQPPASDQSPCGPHPCSGPDHSTPRNPTAAAPLSSQSLGRRRTPQRLPHRRRLTIIARVRRREPISRTRVERHGGGEECGCDVDRGPSLNVAPLSVRKCR